MAMEEIEHESMRSAILTPNKVASKQTITTYQGAAISTTTIQQPVGQQPVQTIFSYGGHSFGQCTTCTIYYFDTD